MRCFHVWLIRVSPLTIVLSNLVNIMVDFYFVFILLIHLFYSIIFYNCTVWDINKEIN